MTKLREGVPLKNSNQTERRKIDKKNIKMDSITKMRVRKVLLSNKPEGIEVILLLCIVIKQMCKQTSEED